MDGLWGANGQIEDLILADEDHPKDIPDQAMGLEYLHTLATSMGYVNAKQRFHWHRSGNQWFHFDLAAIDLETSSSAALFIMYSCPGLTGICILAPKPVAGDTLTTVAPGNIRWILYWKMLHVSIQWTRVGFNTHRTPSLSRLKESLTLL